MDQHGGKGPIHQQDDLTSQLCRLAGRKRLLELLLTGDSFSPQRACELGLVNQVVPHDTLMPTASELASRILRHSPLAAARIITAATRGLNTSIAEGLQIEREEFAPMAATQDCREGLEAWIERRTPVYQGRRTLSRPIQRAITVYDLTNKAASNVRTAAL